MGTVCSILVHVCWLVGDDSLSSGLQLLTAIEIVTNREYYAEHPKIEEAAFTNASCNATRYSESMQVLFVFGTTRSKQPQG